VFKGFVFLFFAFIVSFSLTQHEDFLQTHVESISSESFQGRKSGTIGQKLAAIYLQEQFVQSEIQTFEFVNITHGGSIFNSADTLYHKHDFFYHGFYEPTEFTIDSSWTWNSLTAEEFIVSSRIKSEEKVVFLIENWSTFLDLIGHEFSKEELRLCDDLEMKQRIYINSEKTKPSDDWRASIVKKSSKVFTENIFVPLIWSEKNKETVLLTAHYDHLGLDSTGIYFGADDNASGVSLLLLFGDWLQQKKITETQTKNVVLVFFSGEEQGLLGSRHFVKSERLPLSTITACVNFDMVGFVNQEKPRAFIVAYNDTDTNTIFVSKNTSIELVNERHFLHEFSSDQQSFADEKILSFLVFTGLHDFYHTTQDTPEKINYSAMNDLFLFLTKWMQDRLFID